MTSPSLPRQLATPAGTACPHFQYEQAAEEDQCVEHPRTLIPRIPKFQRFEPILVEYGLSPFSCFWIIPAHHCSMLVATVSVFMTPSKWRTQKETPSEKAFYIGSRHCPSTLCDPCYHLAFTSTRFGKNNFRSKKININPTNTQPKRLTHVSCLCACIYPIASLLRRVSNTIYDPRMNSFCDVDVTP